MECDCKKLVESGVHLLKIERKKKKKKRSKMNNFSLTDQNDKTRQYFTDRGSSIEY